MTGKRLEQQLENCIGAYQDGSLSEEMLREVLETARSDNGKSQDILYLQAVTTSLASQVQGMLLMENGEIVRLCWRQFEMGGGSSSFRTWHFCWMKQGRTDLVVSLSLSANH